MKVSAGPKDATIMFVGEAPGSNESDGHPFAGKSGYEFTHMLVDAGIAREAAYVTNVCHHRPSRNEIANFFHETVEAKKSGRQQFNGLYPNDFILNGISLLWRDVEAINPNLIVALGNVPLWAMVGCGSTSTKNKRRVPAGVNTWRSSVLEGTGLFEGRKIIPVLHPSAIIRVWKNRWDAVQDFRRCKREMAYPDIRMPDYKFITEPDFKLCTDTLKELLQRAQQGSLLLADDIETYKGHIFCNGIGWSATEALCIPFMWRDRPYWSRKEEYEILILMRDLLTHSNVGVVGQNFLFDDQYFARSWGFVPNLVDDTMLSQNVCFPGSKKGLDYMSSIYCNFHRYWKDEGKKWNEKKNGEQVEWKYNCKDCVATYEIHKTLLKTRVAFNLVEPQQRQIGLFTPTLRMNIRGVRVDEKARRQLRNQLKAAQIERQSFINNSVGYEINLQSPQQMVNLFYNDLKEKPIRNWGAKGLTADEKALKKISDRTPILKPLCDAINEFRSISGIMANFIDKRPDKDGRVRSMFNPAGTESFRYNSSTNAFGSGGNLENLTDGVKSPHLPNVRKLIIPDEGFTILACDQEKAEAQIVAAEARDKVLLQMFKEHVNIHLENAKAIFGGNPEHHGAKYQLAKRGVHLLNYGGGDPMLATALGITRYEAGKFRKAWFGAHPAIPAWHKRIMKNLVETRSVANKFGYRIFFFDRVEKSFKKAIAWIPQSTSACVTNRGLRKIEMDIPWAEMLIQLHDENVLQVPTVKCPEAYAIIRNAMLVEIPYDEPFTIDVNVSASTKSWGDVEGVTL